MGLRQVGKLPMEKEGGRPLKWWSKGAGPSESADLRETSYPSTNPPNCTLGQSKEKTALPRHKTLEIERSLSSARHHIFRARQTA